VSISFAITQKPCYHYGSAVFVLFMRFDIITIFPRIFDSYFDESILARAQKKKLIEIRAHDLRKWTKDKHKKVDDSPYGGGPGMIFKVEPLWRAVESVKKLSKSKTILCHPGLDPGSRLQTKSLPTSLYEKGGEDLDSRFPVYPREGGGGNDKGRASAKQRIILFSAKGKTFTQADARRLAKYDQLILICGRYEGVDERVAEHIADEELSVGNFVLTGGEIPAMIVVDSISRLIPGVLGKSESLKEESFSANKQLTINSKQRGENQYLEYPQYTRPEKFKGWKVPEVLLGGNHKEIQKWREKENKG